MYHVGDNITLKEVSKLIKNADVLHFNEYQKLLSMYRVNPEECRDKKVIFHAHGSRFRRGPKATMNFYKDKFPQMKLITSTADLTQGIEHSSWFPSVIPVEEYREKYKMQRNDPPVIYYSPTRPRGLPVLMRVRTTLLNEGLEFETKVVRGQLHRVNMEQKSKADIYYDELYLFYGVNALEAAVFELSVVYGWSKFVKDYMISNEINCPFAAIDMKDKRGLTDELRRMITDKEYRQRLGKEGYEYVKSMHSPKVCAERFLSLMED